MHEKINPEVVSSNELTVDFIFVAFKQMQLIADIDDIISSAKELSDALSLEEQKASLVQIRRVIKKIADEFNGNHQTLVKMLPEVVKYRESLATAQSAPSLQQLADSLEPEPMAWDESDEPDTGDILKDIDDDSMNMEERSDSSVFKDAIPYMTEEDLEEISEEEPSFTAQGFEKITRRHTSWQSKRFDSVVPESAEVALPSLDDEPKESLAEFFQGTKLTDAKAVPKNTLLGPAPYKITSDYLVAKELVTDDFEREDTVEFKNIKSSEELAE
jgi:hypothetical protein